MLKSEEANVKIDLYICSFFFFLSLVLPSVPSVCYALVNAQITNTSKKGKQTWNTRNKNG